jgi:hypothetical protein
MRHGGHSRRPDGRLAIKCLLDLNGRDSPAARDDDVFRPVLELDVFIGMHHAQITGMKPPAGKCLSSRGGVPEIALHYNVAPEHDFAHGLAVTAQAWSRDPFRLTRETERLHGPGTTDMKGSLAAMPRAADMASKALLSEPLKLSISYHEEPSEIALAQQLDDGPISRLRCRAEATAGTIQ